MWQKIQNFAQKPALYQRSNAKFWDDPHLSQSMLKAHLNPHLESATRKLDFVTSSVEWISRILPAQKYPRLMDLGCGPGIYGELFYSKGYSVTGVDLSKNSVDYAEQSAKTQGLDIQYLNEDYLRSPFLGTFDLVTMIYCDFGALSGIERSLLLQKIYDRLSPNGCFLFDVFTWFSRKNEEEFRVWSLEENGFWRSEPYLLLHSFYRYEEDRTFLNQYLVITESEITNYHIWDHTFSLEELQQDLQAAGFQSLEFYENVVGDQVKKESPTLCVIARK